MGRISTYLYCRREWFSREGGDGDAGMGRIAKAVLLRTLEELGLMHRTWAE